MKKLIIITTVPLSLATLVRGQPKYLSKFFNVTLITSSSPSNRDIEVYEGVKVISIDMSRKITPIKDLKSLIKIYLYFLKTQPDIVYSFTPKAGLLGMVASFFARVPKRVHNIVGMPLMEASGKKRILLEFIERVTYYFATNLFCNSYGLREFIHNNITKREIRVIGYGSINGVDTEFFRDIYTKEEKDRLRKELNIKEKDFVLLFIGRVVKDKGVDELIEAFTILNRKYRDIKLLIVGDFEADLNPIDNIEMLNSNQNIIRVDFQKDIRPYLSISSLFVLPSYREGLPNSLLEAGSFGVPLLATDINGCNEIIIDRENGILVEKKSIDSLANGIESLIKDKKLYLKLKSNVRNSIIKRYNQELFLSKLKDELDNL